MADLTSISVDIRNNAKLQYNGAAVKQRAVVIEWSPVYQGSKEFIIRLLISMYENISNAYGSRILDLILTDVTLSNEEKTDLLERYRDRNIFYTTQDKWVDASGNIVPQGTAGAQTELTYWQTFKLNNAAFNLTSASTQGALDAEYKIIAAIVNRLDTRKNI